MQTPIPPSLRIGRCFSESLSVSLRHFFVLSIASVLTVVLSVASASLLLGCLYAGLLAMILKGMRGESPRLRDLFGQLRRLLRFFCISWFAVILTVVGLVLLVAPGVLFGVWCFHMLLLAADQNASLDEAFVESRKAVRRYGFRKHLVLLLLAAVVVLGTGAAAKFTDVLTNYDVFPIRGVYPLHVLAVILQPFALGLVVSAYHQTLEEEARQREEHHHEFQVMRDELQTAHDMQMDLLPSASPGLEGYGLHGVCIPANNVGGDYYSYRWLDDEKTLMGILVADVSGKAMEAAVTALRFNEMLRYECRERTAPGDILDGLNASLEGQIDTATFITACMAVLDTTRHSVHIANAGHCLPYVYRQSDSRVASVDITGYPLGLPTVVRPDEPYASVTLDLSPGDALFLYSDGVVEAQDLAQELYGEERFAEWLATTAGGPDVSRTVESAVRSVDRFVAGAPRTDDVTLVALKRNNLEGGEKPGEGEVQG